MMQKMPRSSVGSAKGTAQMHLTNTLFTMDNLVCVVLMAFAMVYVSNLFLTLNDITYSTRTIASEEKGYNLYSEQAFYYSFYDDIVKAPSFHEGVQGLTANTRSEYPDTINTLNRFNIYPEVIMAFAYRVMGSSIYSDPFDFMMVFVCTLVGLQTAMIYLTARNFGKSNVCGIAAALLVTLNFFEFSRAQTHPMLREGFALPFLWMQVSFMHGCVAAEASMLRLIGLTLSSTAFLLFWQFSQYPLLLQSVALYLVYSIGRMGATRVNKIYASQLIAVVVASTLMFGNEMLLTSLQLIFCLAAMTVIEIERALTSRSNSCFNTSLLYVALRVAAVAGLTLACKVGFNNVMGIEDDAHVLLILKAHLVGYEDFTTLQYLCGHAYNPLPGWAITNLMNSLLIPAAAAVYICLLVKTGLDWMGDYGVVSRNNVRAGDASMPFLFAQSSGLILLGFLMLRMLPFFTPTLAIMGSLLFTDKYELLLPAAWLFLSDAETPYADYKKTDGDTQEPAPQPNRKSGKKKGSTRAQPPAALKVRKGGSSAKASQTQTLYSIITWMIRAAMFFAIVTAGWTRFSTLINAQRKDQYGIAEPKMLVMEWIETNLPKDAVITASMDLSSHVKLATRRPITIHPHAEKRNMRDRYKLQYQSYAKVSEADVYSAMKELKTEYVITSGCMAKCAGGYGYDYIASQSGVKNTGMPTTERFCQMAVGNSASLKNFELLYITPNKSIALYKVL
ncbi:hypothetical protein SARC_05252 [Sphaeroforma arctica JP610]|uniref:Uncharacterized protein n=1 Tax=Sphaeroforma arctica JP610 TaxID=667725 RepID=A0A0L0G062_9EUKA|nr:hypothetical protein SARC_05252 [Sphaeroforma arctica JP610]KNC82460.1 hypothetical protein SARC_05252 [Sphaeroforma arctica JP610]|eukprot:XP_014156362.1 hypothetical protein SARC_05252 [Sphaeroforma arctica JP610]